MLQCGWRVCTCCNVGVISRVVCIVSESVLQHEWRVCWNMG